MSTADVLVGLYTNTGPFARGIDIALAHLAMAVESRDGPLYVEAVREAGTERRRRFWNGPALFLRPNARERATGIPEGWLGRP